MHRSEYNMAKTVYLVRHGAINIGKERRYIGSTELSLSEKGIGDGAALRDFFQEIPIDLVFLSPMKRCIETAELLFSETQAGTIFSENGEKEKNQKNGTLIHGGMEIPYEIREALREIHMGEWEGVPMKEIRQRYPEAYLKRGEELDCFRPPKGESFQEVQERAVTVVKEIFERKERNILILSHSGVNRALLSYFSGALLKDLMKLEVPYGSVYRLHFSEYRICDKIERIK